MRGRGVKLALVLAVLLAVSGMRFGAARADGLYFGGRLGAKGDAVSRVVPSATAVKLTLGDKKQLSAFVEPASADQRVVWYSQNPKVVQVDPTGLVNSRGLGRTVVEARSYAAPGVWTPVKFKVLKGVAPTKIVLGGVEASLSPGETLQLVPAVLPEKASQAVSYSSSDKGVVTVSEDGLITAVGDGEANVRVRSAVKPAVRASILVRVFDPLTPREIQIDDSGFLEKGETRPLAYKILPETAVKDVTFTSSNPSVVSVTSAGVLHALGAGQAKITITCAKGGLSAALDCDVINGARVTAIPARITPNTASAVEGNLKKIDAIHESAVRQLELLEGKGLISAAEGQKRREVLKNAFAMQRFPWYTTQLVKYWSAHYSMNGKKDFKPGNVYYGLPYIQYGSGNNHGNRRFNVERAIKTGYYAKAEGALYRMTTKRFAEKYVGNDCSAFCNMSILTVGGFPAAGSVCAMITRQMLGSSHYRKLAGYEDLRPGDIIIKSGHTLLFLYYANAAHTRMMIIEQGGGSAQDIHNTICLSVVNRSAYEGKYIPMRASFLAK